MAGVDGIWLTEDDVTSQRIVLAGWNGAHHASGTIYRGPGGDGTWGTADDTATGSLAVTQVDGIDRQLQYDLGPDGLVHTADDVPIARVDMGLDQTGAFTVAYFLSGDDRVFATPDDEILARLVFDCDGGRETDYLGPGADGVWATADDEIAEVVRLVSGRPCQNLCQVTIP
jgi:hypothetical protein